MGKTFKNILFKARALQLSLFCLLPYHLSCYGQAGQFSFQQAAYSAVLNFNFDEARKKLNTGLTDVHNPYDLYVLNLADALEVFLSDSEELYSKRVALEEQRLQQLKMLSDTLPEKLFLEAEIRIHWAFVKLRFGSYFKAFLNFRQAYFSTTDNLKRFPDFIPSQKSMGVLLTILGSFPDSYSWVLTLAGIKGDLNGGISALDRVSKSNSPLAIETKIYKSIFQTFLLNQKEEALIELSKSYKGEDYTAVALLKTLLLTKNSESKQAQYILLKMEQNNLGDKIPFIYYLLGETYLQEHEHLKSIAAYKRFIAKHKGNNYVKDAYTKIALNYWLSDSEKYKLYVEKAANSGTSLIDADKNAAKLIENEQLPNKSILRIRYATDGGYYDLAGKIIQSTRESDFEREDDVLEFYYRKARYYHKTNAIAKAKSAYQKVIALQKERSLYFAPNSCLELGYILSSENKTEDALLYFERAKKYKNHPYKYSIDKKADIEIGRILEMNKQ